MFGLLVSGRLVDTAFRQVDQTHAVIDISDVNNFNHIVVRFYAYYKKKSENCIFKHRSVVSVEDKNFMHRNISKFTLSLLLRNIFD